MLKPCLMISPQSLVNLSAGKPGNASQVIMQQSFEPDGGAKPQRHRLNLPLDLHPGDIIDFVTQARENHDCDGVYLIDVQVRHPHACRSVAQVQVQAQHTCLAPSSTQRPGSGSSKPSLSGLECTSCATACHAIFSMGTCCCSSQKRSYLTLASACCRSGRERGSRMGKVPAWRSLSAGGSSKKACSSMKLSDGSPRRLFTST